MVSVDFTQSPCMPVFSRNNVSESIILRTLEKSPLKWLPRNKVAHENLLAVS